MRSYIRPVVEARTPRAPMEIRHTRTDQLNDLAGQETPQVACVSVRPMMPSNYALSLQSIIRINDDELAVCQAGWG